MKELTDVLERLQISTSADKLSKVSLEHLFVIVILKYVACQIIYTYSYQLRPEKMHSTISQTSSYKVKTHRRKKRRRRKNRKWL